MEPKIPAEIGQQAVDALPHHRLGTGTYDGVYPIGLDGILRVEHSPSSSGARVRVIYAGSPLDDTPPKTSADEESLGAAYLTLDEIAKLPLRGADLRVLLESVARGRQVFPLDMLGRELSI